LPKEVQHEATLFRLCCIYFARTYLKNKIRVQGKARSGEKAEHTR